MEMDNNEPVRYAKRDIEAQIEEEGGPVNRLIAIQGQPISPAYLPYVDEDDYTTDGGEASVLAEQRTSSQRAKQAGLHQQTERSHEEIRRIAAGEPASEGDTEDEDDEVNATEGAVELAEDEGVDIADVEGSGKGGRVTVDDVKAHLAASEGDTEDEEDED